jgi:hypothetical protein
MRCGSDDAHAGLVELLAREHRTVEGLVDELTLLDAGELDDPADLLPILRTCSQRSKHELVQALCGRR